MNGWLRTVVLLLLLVCAFGRQGRSSLITGRVVDDQGRPVKGADIGIFEDLSGPGRWEDVR